MKKILLLLFAFAIISTTFTSCDINGLGGENNSSISDKPNGLSEDGNKLYYKIGEDYGYGVGFQILWTFTFDASNKCSKAECEYDWGNATLADVFYDELVNDEETIADYPVSKKGSVVNIDYTVDYKGMSREEIKEGLSVLPELAAPNR